MSYNQKSNQKNYTNKYNSNKPTNNSSFSGNKSTNTKSKNKLKDVLNEEIKPWVKSITDDNFEEKVNTYDSKKIEWQKNYIELLRYMTIKHKYRMLDHVLKNQTELDISSTDTKKTQNFSLLNENVWSKDSNNNINFNDIKQTFDVLISNGYNFIDLSVINNETTNKTEIFQMLSNPPYFYQGIIIKNKKIPELLLNQLHNYIFIRMRLTNKNSFINSISNLNSNVKATIINIINEYYSEENIINLRLKQTESFLGAIICEHNKIKSELKTELYNYFTKIYWNKDNFVSCLKVMFNKITESNSKLFIDNIQFILSRNPEIMSWEIFKLLVLRESTTVTEKIIVNSLISDLIGREDLKDYFTSIDINLVRNSFISYIIVNYSEWIKDIVRIQSSKNPDIELYEFITNNYSVLMMIFGIAYSKGFMKDLILTEIFNIIDDPNINLIKPFGVFLETSNIIDNILTEKEYNLISKYINTFYFNKSYGFREKLIIETILSNFSSKNKKNPINIRAEQINSFIKTGSFINIKNNKITQSKNTTNINIKNSINVFSNLLLDDESEYESVDELEDELKTDFIELPEPDDRIVKNINSYFRCSKVDFYSAYDDLKYNIEKMDININNFICGLVYSLGERKLEEISQIKNLIDNIKLISGFEEISYKLEQFINLNFDLIEELKCDNPKLNEIIESI